MHRFRYAALITMLVIFAILLAACTTVPAAPAESNADAAATEAPVAAVPAGGVTELRITWYDDGSEGAILRDLLDRFEADNPDIKVIIDTVPYSSGILETLPLQLEAGEGPDMARVTQLGGLSKYMLDLRPYLSAPAYWDENFGPFLAWMQTEADGNAIPGFMTQLTVTGPFINRTLFEQAGVAVPSDASDQVTWQEWVAAAREVAAATDTFALAMDRSGHRLAGPAVSMGATYFDADGNPALVGDQGFKDMAQLMIDWHADGTMIPEVWIGSAGSYQAANEPFVNGQLAMYMSGSWQIGQFNTNIADAFDWEAVPNPCGPGGCTGMPGGAALVAINTTKHPEAVARVMEYLTDEAIMNEFYARTLFIPGHLGLAAKGIEFQAELPQTLKSLQVFSSEVGKLAPLAYDLQAYKYNTILFNATRDRLTQVFTGELTLDEAIQKMQEDIDAGIAAAQQ
ncbi:ABC transporter substrate-binding protein [Caldilinea sp.]|uniref:ABC transporter substrate-binding protein n=1 Tax=Caldilinea sp. TaxID=2293560 RepID=UPI002B7F7734|nr:ABC transporter substrate-binding protein [Caldilinea sp.]HRA65428.1 ABC transporter substrate-binding protein [Caldilinea sp.]